MSDNLINQVLEISQEYNDKMEPLLEKLRENPTEYFQPLFEKFFEDFPVVYGLRWTAYAPSFNDGDRCEFSVHDFELSLRHEGDDDIDDEDREYDVSSYSDELDKHPGLEHAMDALQEKIHAFSEEVMIAAFGEDVQVTVTREGIEIEEYDHD